MHLLPDVLGLAEEELQVFPEFGFGRGFYVVRVCEEPDGFQVGRSDVRVLEEILVGLVGFSAVIFDWHRD